MRRSFTFFPQHEGTTVFHHHAERRVTTDGVPPVRHISGCGWIWKATGEEIRGEEITPNPGEGERRETKSGRLAKSGTKSGCQTGCKSLIIQGLYRLKIYGLIFKKLKNLQFRFTIRTTKLKKKDYMVAPY